jgi:hypothetical protein
MNSVKPKKEPRNESGFPAEMNSRSEEGEPQARRENEFGEAEEAEASHLDESTAIVTDAIERAGMAAPAMIALQIAKPLAWVAGQMAWVLQPFLGSIRIGSRGGALSVAGIATFLETEGCLDTLLNELTGDGYQVMGDGGMSVSGGPELAAGQEPGKGTLPQHPVLGITQMPTPAALMPDTQHREHSEHEPK